MKKNKKFIENEKIIENEINTIIGNEENHRQWKKQKIVRKGRQS